MAEGILLTPDTAREIATNASFNGDSFEYGGGKGVRVRRSVGISPYLDHNSILIQMFNAGVEGILVERDLDNRIIRAWIDPRIKHGEIDAFMLVTSGDGEITIGGFSGSISHTDSGRRNTGTVIQEISDSPGLDGMLHSSEVRISILE